MAKYLYIVFPMIAALLAVGVAQADSPTEVEGATTVDVTAAKALFDRGVPFVDVRNDRYYGAGHISGAAHLRVSTAFSESALADVASKNQEVVIYCDGPWCPASSEACEMAVSWGWKKVYYFREGYPGWKAAGYPSK